MSKKRVQILLEPKTIKRVKELAKDQRRSFSDYCRVVLEDHTDAE